MLTITELASLLPREGRVVLESGAPADFSATQSFAASCPSEVLKVEGSTVDGQACDGERTLDALQERLDSYAARARRRCPIAMGYFSYEFGRTLMGLGCQPTRLPRVWIGFYPAFVSMRFGEAAFEVSGYDSESCRLLESVLEKRPFTLRERPFQFGPLEASAEEDRAYRRAFKKVQEYLHAGDAYQVNIARELRAKILEHGDPLALLKRMRERAPSAYAALIECAEGAIFSASPERLFSYDGVTRRLETRPIKGTRKVVGTAEAEARVVAELARDPKENAEHLMIVDLERNDLGRVADIGSVRVERYAEVVTLPKVHHLVSTISALARAECSQRDIIAAMFPGGSITGAPKRRAMEIIDECETSSRGAYCGSAAIFFSDGSMDFSILIRSAEMVDDWLSLRVGGGLVVDSRLEREFEETEEKAAAWRSVIA